MQKESDPARSARITVPLIRSLKSQERSRRRISALTAYDYTTARLLDETGVDLILVGDSLGNVIQGLETTLPVTLDEMIYHARCVTRGVKHALVVGDLPFLSYQVSAEQALQSAGRLIKEGGVAAVKLEGGQAMADAIARLVAVDIPVVGHIGLTPQSYHRMGGYKVQGRDSEARERLLADARAVEEAGAFALVVEGVPSTLGGEISRMLSIPTIGIGAGAECDGQILVIHDLLGLGDAQPTFVKRYADLANTIRAAIGAYIEEVQSGAFPAAEHSFLGGSTPRGVPTLKRVSKM